MWFLDPALRRFLSRKGWAPCIGSMKSDILGELWEEESTLIERVTVIEEDFSEICMRWEEETRTLNLEYGEVESCRPASHTHVCHVLSTLTRQFKSDFLHRTHDCIIRLYFVAELVHSRPHNTFVRHDHDLLQWENRLTIDGLIGQWLVELEGIIEIDCWITPKSDPFRLIWSNIETMFPSSEHPRFDLTSVPRWCIVSRRRLEHVRDLQHVSCHACTWLETR